MPFYLRKSVSVGPFRFNLSKSGVGVSAGVRGLRVGAGPRGNYVHMGRGGLYYRATLPSGSSSSLAPSQKPSVTPDAAPDALTDIESGDVSQMTDTSSADLLAEFDRKRQKARIAPLIAVPGVVVVLGLFAASVPTWITGAIVAVTLGIFWIAKNRDELAKTVVLFYEIEKDF